VAAWQQTRLWQARQEDFAGTGMSVKTAFRHHLAKSHVLLRNVATSVLARDP
jgi:hypothetical protein